MTHRCDAAVLDVLRRVAGARGDTPSAVALAWLWAKPGVPAPIVSATKMSHLDAAIAAMSIKLSTEELSALEAPYQPHPVRGH